MLLAGMGAGLHFKRPWEQDEQHQFHIQEPGSPQSPSQTRPFLPANSSLPVPRLPPISTTLNRPSTFKHEPYVSVPLVQSDPSRPTTSLDSPPERSPKRPRWFYDGKFQAGLNLTAGSPSAPDVLDTGHRHEDRDQRADIACNNCADTETLIEKLLSGLLGLEIEVRQLLRQAGFTGSASEELERGIHGLDLRSSLAWACGSIQMSMSLLKQNVTARPPLELPPLDVASTSEPPDVTSAPPSLSRRILDMYDKSRPEDDSRRHTSAGHSHHPPRSTDYPSPSTMFTDPRRGFSADNLPSQAPHSPHRSGSVSTYGSGQSPRQMQSLNRTLPSPSSTNYPSSVSGPPTTYSLPFNASAQSAHLQDLQHQISTKTLALQTLQREHDQLLAAFSRSQIRCSALDKKSQVSDQEINSLAEERARLQGQVEALEAQVEDLIHSKDEMSKQTMADSAQWHRIMAMSSQLQARGIEESRRYKIDREAWERDRDGLQRRISELESGNLALIDSTPSAGSTVLIASDDILASSSLEQLRAEIVRLRSRCAEMENALQEMRQVTTQMDAVMGELGNIRQRISAQASQGGVARDEAEIPAASVD